MNISLKLLNNEMKMKPRDQKFDYFFSQIAHFVCMKNDNRVVEVNTQIDASAGLE
jgi:hypothetical protein